jgi:hypothetical protein
MGKPKGFRLALKRGDVVLSEAGRVDVVNSKVQGGNCDLCRDCAV